MRTFELHLSSKTIYGIETQPGTVTVSADCRLMEPYGMVKFCIPTPQAEQLFAQPRQRHVQEIAPELHKSLREIFISGTSPMEFEQMTGGDPDYTLVRYNGAYVAECPHCHKEASKFIRRGEHDHWCETCAAKQN